MGPGVQHLALLLPHLVGCRAHVPAVAASGCEPAGEAHRRAVLDSTRHMHDVAQARKCPPAPGVCVHVVGWGGGGGSARTWDSQWPPAPLSARKISPCPGMQRTGAPREPDSQGPQLPVPAGGAPCRSCCVSALPPWHCRERAQQQSARRRENRPSLVSRPSLCSRAEGRPGEVHAIIVSS